MEKRWMILQSLLEPITHDRECEVRVSPVRLLHFVIKNYKEGKFEILTESDSSVTMKSNRPYKAYFKDGPQLGVTIEENGVSDHDP